jgi:hypothetical protein
VGGHKRQNTTSRENAWLGHMMMPKKLQATNLQLHLVTLRIEP